MEEIRIPDPREMRCVVCDAVLLKIDHFEPDGINEYGSYEPYYECPNGHAQDDESVIL